MRAFYATVLTLVIIGGLNWGLVGLFNYNLVDAIFGATSWFSRLIYILVGVSAIFSFAFYGYERESERN
jgi:uncharacterized membrane protein YuzA (DUF378 family)